MNLPRSGYSANLQERKRAIAYSMDALIPGLYIWFGAINFRLGGSPAEKSYPGTIHSPAGIALVLPGIKSGVPIKVAMTLDKHQIDGIASITSKTLPAQVFNQLLLDAGYTKIGTAPAQGNRVKAWWTHPHYRAR